jgi:hypothetical protein
MSRRICVLTLTVGCLFLAAPTARAAVIHHHLENTHVNKAGTGSTAKYTHGKTSTGHDISTTHGPMGKVRAVHVGNSTHSKTYKVAMKHAKSMKVAGLAPAGTGPALTLAEDGDEESCQVFLFAAFVVDFGGNTFVILVPLQFVASQVIFSPGNPPDPTCDNGDPEVRLLEPVLDARQPFNPAVSAALPF